jgi:hypothetical protein
MTKQLNKAILCLMLTALLFTTAKSQVDSKLNEKLLRYFKHLPGNKDLGLWLGEIKSDSTIKIDTIISRSSPSSLFLLVKGSFLNLNLFNIDSSSSYFHIRITTSARKYGFDTLMNFSVSSSLDSSETNIKILRNEYKRLNKEFKGFFARNYEISPKRKTDNCCLQNSYFLNVLDYYQFLAISLVKSYKPHGYAVTMSLLTILSK